MDDRSAPAGTSGGTLENAWRAVGRDNPAGQALFKLYNKGAATKIGNSLSAKNKAAHDKKLATGWSPPPVAEPPRQKFERPQVDVPKFPKRIEYDTAKINYIMRRRPVAAIQADIDAEYERMRSVPQPAPNRPVLDDREKDRLAELMRFRGKVPTVTPEALASQLKAGSKKSEREQLEELFDSIAGEIEERRQFLRDLEKAGRLKLETVHMIRAEIQQRVTELQRVDALLKQASG